MPPNPTDEAANANQRPVLRSARSSELGARSSELGAHGRFGVGGQARDPPPERGERHHAEHPDDEAGGHQPADRGRESRQHVADGERDHEGDEEHAAVDAGGGGREERRPDDDPERVGRDDVASRGDRDLQVGRDLRKKAHGGELGGPDAETTERQREHRRSSPDPSQPVRTVSDDVPGALLDPDGGLLVDSSGGAHAGTAQSADAAGSARSTCRPPTRSPIIAASG